jgi:hypothetical protein
VRVRTLLVAGSAATKQACGTVKKGATATYAEK